MRKLVVGLLLLVCTACAASREGLHKCRLEDLLLDASAFPANAVTGEIVSPLPEVAVDSAGWTIYWREGLANHDVYQHSGPARAAKDFEHRKLVKFSEHRGGPWETPAELSYRSPIADQYCVACGMQDNIYMCKVLARYEEYYVFLNAHMSPDAMTIQDFEHLMRLIDERMAECLDKPLPEMANQTPTAVSQ